MKAGSTNLLLVDSATSGLAGAYIDALYSNLEDRDDVEVAVSHYFPFPYGLRIFYRFSELTAQQHYRLGRARLYVRFAELVWSLASLLAFMRRRRVRVLCYALSSNLRLEYAFLAAVRRMGIRVDLICHDVVPYALPGQQLDAMIRTRSRFYQLADRLIVHNEHSVRELRETFGIAEDKVRLIPFPVYDDHLGLERPLPTPQPTPRRFLFIGHLRPEKGIDVLLEAWRRFFQPGSDVELVIAGTIPRGSRFDFSGAASCNVRLLDRYVTDEEYVRLVTSAHCVVLPYSRGTNSGVVMTVLAMRRNLIVSDIEMFRQNPIIPKESFFRNGDPGDLAEKLRYFACLDEAGQQRLDAHVAAAYQPYVRAFRSGVNATLGRDARRGAA